MAMAPNNNSPSLSGQPSIASTSITDHTRASETLDDTVVRNTSSALLDGEAFERKVGLAVVVAVLFLDSVLLSCIVPIVPHYLGEKNGEFFVVVDALILQFCLTCAARSAPPTSAHSSQF